MNPLTIGTEWIKMNPLTIDTESADYWFDVGIKNPCREIPMATLQETISKAFDIPFDQLPLYVNHASEVIRLIARERLKSR